MYIDRQHLFSQDQPVTQSAASADYIDLGTTKGGNLELLVICTQDFESEHDVTLTIALQGDDSPSFSSPCNLVLSDALRAPDLRVGFQVIRCAIPYGTERYTRLHYTAGGGTFTAGKLTAGIVPRREANVAYAASYQP